jgi:catechol 2,3-dioxygenase-like lactoylglutathione lyase family enzyme
MLGDINSIATVAVRDINQASRFYESILGLTPIAREGDDVVTYRTGDCALNVYVSTYAGTNQATSVTWNVGDRLPSIVRELRDKGVTFEHYDLPGMVREGDIHRCGDLHVAWFKDPDGNIMNLVNG